MENLLARTTRKLSRQRRSVLTKSNTITRFANWPISSVASSIVDSCDFLSCNRQRNKRKLFGNKRIAPATDKREAPGVNGCRHSLSDPGPVDQAGGICRAIRRLCDAGSIRHGTFVGLELEPI